MQKQTDFHVRKSSVLIFFTIFTLFYICGCTTKAIKYAETKAEDTFYYSKIKAFRNGTMEENGDILACVDLVDLNGFKEPECLTIVLPISSLAKGHIDKNVYGLKELSEYTDILGIYKLFDYPLSWKFYLYPIEKAQKGCDNISLEKFSAAESSLPIENINVTRSRAIREKLVEKRSPEDKIYAVGWATHGETWGIHLIYWPSQMKQEQEGIDPAVIAGGYQFEEKGTNLGYLLVFPAAIMDLILIGLSAPAWF